MLQEVQELKAVLDGDPDWSDKEFGCIFYTLGGEGDDLLGFLGSLVDAGPEMVVDDYVAVSFGDDGDTIERRVVLGGFEERSHGR